MLTAVILTRNEQQNLLHCLGSLSFCDNILIIDDGSTDDTVAIAKSSGAKVLNHSLNGDFSRQRNFALSQIKTGWVLFVDTDEQVSPELSLEIVAATKQTRYQAFYLQRLDTLWGKMMRHGDTGVKLIRLALVGSGSWQGRVHETWKINGLVGSLKSVLHHYPHQKFAEFITGLNYYSTLRARELYGEHKRANILSVIFYPLGKFITLYLIKAGILDGIRGLISAISMSFYSFLVRGKLYLMAKHNQVADV